MEAIKNPTRELPASNSSLVAIPVFNESEYVDDVLHTVWRYSANILVVDDGSTDSTPDILKKHTYLQIISHKTNMGYGQSLIDAFDFAFNHDFD